MFLTSINQFFKFTCPYSLIDTVHLTPRSEGVVVYIVYLNYFYFWVASLMSAYLSTLTYRHSWYLVFFLYWKILTSNSPLSPIFLRCTYCRPSALMGFKYGSPFFPLYVHTFLCPPLWFISLNVALSEYIIYLYIASRPNWRRFPPLYILKNTISLSLNCCVWLLSDAI